MQSVEISSLAMLREYITRFAITPKFSEEFFGAILNGLQELGVQGECEVPQRKAA